MKIKRIFQAAIYTIVKNFFPKLYQEIQEKNLPPSKKRSIDITHNKNGNTTARSFDGNNKLRGETQFDKNYNIDGWDIQYDENQNPIHRKFMRNNKVVYEEQRKYNILGQLIRTLSFDGKRNILKVYNGREKPESIFIIKRNTRIDLKRELPLLTAQCTIILFKFNQQNIKTSMQVFTGPLHDKSKWVANGKRIEYDPNTGERHIEKYKNGIKIPVKNNDQSFDKTDLSLNKTIEDHSKQPTPSRNPNKNQEPPGSDRDFA